MENVPAGTLNPHDPSGWLDAAGNFIRRVRSAVRAFRDALHREGARNEGQPEAEGRPAERPAPPQPPSCLDKGELPETYARTKVVAMVVSPYMVHVYWDLAEKDRANAPASLRFHDAGGGESFDVKIDLAAKNWYVHLWSPEKRYEVELGVEKGTQFQALARSNTIETPRAWPVSEVTERFTKVPAQSAESGPGAAPQPETSAKSQPADVLARNVEAVPAGAAAPAAPAPEQPAFGISGVSSRPLAASVPAEQALQRRSESPAPAPANGPGAESAAPARPVQPRLTETSASDVLRKKLAEFYSMRRRKPRPESGQEVPAAAIPAAVLPGQIEEAVPLDWTARVESTFIPGVSSILLGLTAPKKPVA